MSIDALQVVFNHSRATGNDKVVLLAIANHVGDKGTAWPSVTTLARYAGIQQRAARKCVARLEASGELVRVERAGQSSVYRIGVACGPQCEGSAHAPDPSLTPVPADLPSPTPTPVPADRGGRSQRTGEVGPSGPGAPVRTDLRTVKEPSMNRHGTFSAPGSALVAVAATEPDIVDGEIVDDQPPLTSQTLVAEWIDHCTAKPPGRVVGQVAKEVKTMLDEGIDYDRVRRGLAEWHSRGLHPSTLASVVHELSTPQRRPHSRQQETDALFERAAERMGVIL